METRGSYTKYSNSDGDGLQLHAKYSNTNGDGRQLH